MYACMYLIYAQIYIYVLSSYVFLWAEDGIQSSRDLHNPINSYSGEVFTVFE